MDKRGSGPSGPYGQACMQCFKSKCRCVALSDGSGCERCLRLKKQCAPSDLVRRRSAQKNNEPSAQIANLEDKINALVSIVQSVAQSTGVSADLQRALNEHDVTLSATGATTNGPSSTCMGNGAGPTSVPGSPPNLFHADGLSPPSPRLSEPSADEAEGLFAVFRSQMLPCFPFIYLNPSLTGRELRRDRPFLFRAIVTVASPATQQRLARANELRGLLAKAVVVKNQSNIDLLLGLLTYLTWNTDPFLNRASTLSHLMMLAISLVYDLRLGKPLTPDAQVINSMTRGMANIDPHTASEVTASNLSEQQRAVLACFLLSSSISSYFGLIDTIRWTPQMEEALHIVETNKGCPTDKEFAFQVRLQLLAQKAADIREQHEADFARAATTATTAHVPALLYLKALLGQLQELKTSLSPELQQQGKRGVADKQGWATRLLPLLGILVAYAHYVELCINEAIRPASAHAPLLVIPGSTGSTVNSGHVPGFERLQCQWRSIDAIKSWLDLFYAFPPSKCVGLPFHFWSQLVRCIVILKHLTTLEDMAWDCEAVRNRINLMEVLDWMAEKVRLASIEAGEQSDDDLFRQFSKMLRLSRMWAGAKWKTGPPAAEDPNGGVAIADSDTDVWMQSIDFGNNRLFEEVFGWSTSTFT